MAKGKKTSPELKEKCIAIAMSTGNVSEAARQTGVAQTTINTWMKENDELVKLREYKKQEFVNQSWEIISAAERILKGRVERAENFDRLIDKQIEAVIQSEDMTEQEKVNAIEMLSQKKAENTKDMAVILGTLYDKQALANKEATAIVDGNIGIKKFEDL